MKLAIATMLGVLLVSTGAPAAAQDHAPAVPADAAAEAVTPQQVAKEEPRMICTREKATGSNRATRVCRTPEQIGDQQRAAQDSMTRNRSISSRKGS